MSFMDVNKSGRVKHGITSGIVIEHLKYGFGIDTLEMIKCKKNIYNVKLDLVMCVVF